MLVEDEAEQRALADMRELRDADTSFRNIAAQIEQTHGIQIRHRGQTPCSRGQAESGGSLIRVVIAPLSAPARLSPPAERL